MLIATAFIGSTMQTRIDNTQDINKNSYLQAIADNLITSSGTPNNWGTSNGIPQAFGLALNGSAIPYELDIDKISRLNSQNSYTLSYPEIANSAKLNIALGITVSQILSISIQQSESHVIGNNVSYTFTVSTSINSKPTSASLYCYVIAGNFLTNITQSASSSGVGSVSFQIPDDQTQNAMLLVFARAPFDDRLTSYAIYDFSSATQQSTPSNEILTLSPNNYELNISPVFANVTGAKGYFFSYSTQENMTLTSSTQYQIPQVIDKSPFVLVICGSYDSVYFQDWIAYPQVPLNAGANFDSSEKNVFSYIVTINGVLYKLDISLGDVVS